MSKLQGTIETIRQIIAQIGPATARQIETHPEVVQACRSSKAKARRLIERLHQQGHITSSGNPAAFKLADPAEGVAGRPQPAYPKKTSSAQQWVWYY